MVRRQPPGPDASPGNSGAFDGYEEIRLDPRDRVGGEAVSKRKAKTRRNAGNGKSGSEQVSSRRRGTRRGSGPAKQRSLLSRALRKCFYWGTVVGVWLTIICTGIIGYYAYQLPHSSAWTVPQRPPNIKIMSAGGGLIANRGTTGGEVLRLEHMPPYLPEAVIAIEDRRFYSHFGFDPIGFTRAMVTNLTSGRLRQGGSTLTQQLAKNLFLKPERTFRRKVQELVLAIWLESKFSKEQIIELYLNRVYLGGGAYGADAAARRYFGKDASKLTLSEAATLAGLLKAPSRYAPNKNPEGAKKRAMLVLRAMQDQGYITEEERKLALQKPVTTVERHRQGSENYVADWVMTELKGYISDINQDLIVETTIDLRLQLSAEHALVIELREQGEKYGVKQGAVTAIDRDGAVRVMVGGISYAKSQFNRVTQAKRQPGSSFKPFVYLAALEQGYYPGTILNDEPITIGNWSPQNYSKKFRGPVTLTEALALSLNTVAARLISQIGADSVVALAQRLGIHSKLSATPSLALGSSETNLLELTSAYVAFSNGGKTVLPYIIKSVTTLDGQILYQRAGTQLGEAILPAHLGPINAMLQQALERGTGKRAILPGRPAGGKTGTSQDFRDALFIGFTANLTAGVWVGNDDGSATKRASGSNIPASIWHKFMTAAHRGVAVSPLPGVTPQLLAAIGNPVRASSEWVNPDAPEQIPGLPPKPVARSLFSRIFGN
ncbi:MAG: PBP1A family penicillin-binding protein [Cohaesibacteraceae bacterium]|nr:PBP1A family penicillin-binding protein [Cohaesibacteraceae bacterium]